MCGERLDFELASGGLAVSPMLLGPAHRVRFYGRRLRPSEACANRWSQRVASFIPARAGDNHPKIGAVKVRGTPRPL